MSGEVLKVLTVPMHFRSLGRSCKVYSKRQVSKFSCHLLASRRDTLPGCVRTLAEMVEEQCGRLLWRQVSYLELLATPRDEHWA